MAVGEVEFRQLAAELAPASENVIRHLLRDSGIPLSPVVEGVRQNSVDELERTLGALTLEYVAADAGRRAQIRRLVIASRDHARFSRRDEALLWTQTWLENPEVFPVWAALRRQQLRSRVSEVAGAPAGSPPD